MIKKSFICCIVLFIIHIVIVVYEPSIGMATNQWQDNAIKAQQFMYAPNVDTVMVGSSLSARIIRDSIPFVKSISFAGCAVEDGLRIIHSKNYAPKYILVETNIIFKEGNPDLVLGTTEGIIPKLRSFIPSLREQYEPICVFASLLKMMKSLTNITPQREAVNIDLLNKNINQRKKEDKPLQQEKIQERLHEIKRLINAIESEGTQFIFFEMPVNEQLLHLKLYDQTRAVLQREFPKDKYCYLPSDTAKYLTTDGIHLDFDGAQRYSHYFREKLLNFFEGK